MISRLSSHVPPPEPIAGHAGRIVRAYGQARDFQRYPAPPGPI